MSNFYWWWHNRGRHVSAGILDLRLTRSRRIIEFYKNRHAGKRCFIIGNGPSLKKMDLRKLRGEYTFGANRIYLLFPEMGFATSYFISVNTLVIEQCAKEIQNLSMPKFITWRGRRWMQYDPQAIFLDTDYLPPETFSTDVSRRLFEGHTVTYVALQLAFHMGFEQAILIGVDHNFKTSGPANEVVVSSGDDPDHFDPSYFGKGFRWQLPDLEGSERAYRMAKEGYESHGRQVLDATLDGKLTVFPKVAFASLFDE
jgi:hypothetical protein